MLGSMSGSGSVGWRARWATHCIQGGHHNEHTTPHTAYTGGHHNEHTTPHTAYTGGTSQWTAHTTHCMHTQGDITMSTLHHTLKHSLYQRRFNPNTSCKLSKLVAAKHCLFSGEKTQGYIIIILALLFEGFWPVAKRLEDLFKSY